MLTKNDKRWLCLLALDMITFIIYALGNTDHVDMWRRSLKEQASESFSELENV